MGGESTCISYCLQLTVTTDGYSFLSNLETCYSSDLLKKANEFVKDMEGWSKAESPEEESAESAGPSARSGTLSGEQIVLQSLHSESQHSDLIGCR